MKQHRRFGSADANDVEQSAQLPPRHRVPRAGAHARGGGGGGGLLRAPLFLFMIAFFAVGIVYHVYQFSLSLPQYAPLREPFYNKTMVEFTTKFGTFTVDLFPEHAPKSVDNFMKLIENGYYSDKAGFYRNEPGFVLQGGAFLFDKTSPFANVPVEYSLPNTERMVVVARGQKPDSGNAEFAIMLGDNSLMNRPEGNNPGYTAFGRVVRGWHTVEYISKRMREGFLTKEDADRQVLFDKVQLVQRLTNDNVEAKRRIEELIDGIETKHAITIISELDCPQTEELKSIFHDLKAVIRIDEIGYSPAHPYEHEAIRAIAGTSMLPLVYINEKLVGGYDTIKRLQETNRLGSMLEKSGVLAEGVALGAIQHFPLVVFSKSYCPYCKKAKALLASLGATPQVFELDLRDDGPAIQDFLFRFTGQATVPNVFIKGKSIGGSDKTAEMHKTGELLDRLKRAGAVKA